MMQWFVLAAMLAAAAAILWRSERRRPAPPPEPEDGSFARWLEADGGLEELERALAALAALMAHPELGGPGFLSVRLPQAVDDGVVVVTAQYPNIRETLYRRIVRQELDREALRSDGMPKELLDLTPDFETDSGGIVAVSVRAACMDAKAMRGISDRTARQAALELLTRRLLPCCPGFEARSFGAELLLTPVRKGAAVDEALSG